MFLSIINSKVVFWIVVLIIALLVSFGVYLLLLWQANINEKTQSKNFFKLSRSASKKSASFDDAIAMMSMKLASKKMFKNIINPYKKKKIQNEFNVLGIKKTPEEHLIYSVLCGCLFTSIGLLLFLCCLIIGFKIVGICALGLFFIFGLIIGLLSYNEVSSMTLKRKTSIEKELPRFISVVENTIKNDRDVIKLIQNYTSSSEASPLVNELNILLVDLNTGDYEYAFNRFTDRTNSLFVSEIARGLVAAMRGDDVSAYFRMLSLKLWEAEKRRLEKQAMKSPKRVKFLNMALYACMALIYVVVFGSIIYDGLSGIFAM